MNELKCLQAVCQGNRNPTAAGVRLSNQKLLLISAEEGVAFMSKSGGGGAIAAKTGKAYVVGFWDKTGIMTDKKNQNSGDVSINVERVAKFMNAAGF